MKSNRDHFPHLRTRLARLKRGHALVTTPTGKVVGKAHRSRAAALESSQRLADRTGRDYFVVTKRNRNPVKPNTKRKMKPTRAGDHIAASLQKARHTIRKLRSDLEHARKKKNPHRPPKRWWDHCIAGVEAKGGARIPRAVCGARWWDKPEHERMRIVHRLERGTTHQRYKAVALARAERHHHDRGRGRARGKKKSKRNPSPKSNPPRKLVQMVYRERKPGDRREYDYVHDFEGELPDLRMRGGRLQIDGGDYKTKDGWIEG